MILRNKILAESYIYIYIFSTIVVRHFYHLHLLGLF